MNHDDMKSTLLNIHFRAGELAKHFPTKKVITAHSLELGNIRKQADIAILNEDGSVFAVGLQCDDHNHVGLAEDTILMMAISGAKYGFVYANDSGMDPSLEGTIEYYPEHKQSRWFESVDGKVIQISYGPDNVYEAVGI